MNTHPQAPNLSSPSTSNSRGQATAKRYSTVAILLHWAIAILVISMIPMGWWMVRAINNPDTQQIAYQLFQLHKSIGFAILALTLFRVIWRLTHPVPALPSDMKGWERMLARATHIAFYALLLAIPLTGWAYVSTGWAISTDRPLMVATSWFGLFDVPAIPAMDGMRDVAFGAMGAHAYMAYGGAALIVLHVAAALKHQLIDRDGVLAQMLPFLRSKDHGDAVLPGRAMLPRGLGIAFVVMIGLAGYAMHLPTTEAPAQLTVAEAEPVNVAPQAPASPAPAATTSAEANATAWAIDPAASAIRFTGTHAGKHFAGQFSQWSGDIRFDPDNLAGSKAVITVNTGSATTGDATQESSLKNGEWFNARRFPDAHFETKSFRSLGGEHYEADAILTIKNKAVPVVLPFTYKPEGDIAAVEGSIELDRAALNLGMFSDPAADWVSKTIAVTINVTAARS
ncbi:hydrogenase [Ochrobactrum sp. Kaboul]|nr:hydrogenase [Ochrobactrum sp. Kaboul]